MKSSDSIESFSELISQLDNTSKPNYPRLLQSLNISREELYSYAHFCEDKYVRHCFVHNEEYELLLLCWDDGQETPVHAHGGQDCWVRVMDGVIEEKRFRFLDHSEDLEEISRENNGPGALSYMNDRIGLHTLGAPFGRAISLHLYAKPIGSCKIYDSDGNYVEEREMETSSEGV